jgi:hypothetical protein
MNSNRARHALRLVSFLLAIAVAASPALSQTQKPSTNQPKGKTVRKSGSKLSREFRKSALLTKAAWDQLLSSVRRKDPKNVIQRYQDEADKDAATLKADVQTLGDAGANLCLSRYETSVLAAMIDVLNVEMAGKETEDDENKLVAAFMQADSAGRIVDGILSDGIYRN